MNYLTKNPHKALTLIVLFATSLYFARDILYQNVNENVLVSSFLSESPKNKDMLYKLYIVKYKGSSEESRSMHHFDEFNKIYKKHGVKVIGVWYNLDDPSESHFMTAFDDKKHYTSFVEAMKDNKRYQEMSAELADERESLKSYSLKMAVSL
jgi:hypothetical protein